MHITNSGYKELYNFSPNYANVGGHNMHYIDEGSGSPVVLLHGNPSWSFMYRKLIPEIRDFHRVIAPDHIGCGMSDKPSDEKYIYNLQQRINDLESLLEQLEIRKNITLVVHDWGGLIGAGYAVRHPERIAKLVVLNSSAFNTPNGKQLHWTIRFCSQSSLAASLMEKLNAFSAASVILGVRKHRMPAQVKKGYKAPYHNSSDRLAIVRFVQDIPLEESHVTNRTIQEISDSLYKLNRKPMLICWGEKDFVFDLDFLREWQRRFPKADVKRFPLAGHYVLEDEPDEVCGYVKEFLEKSCNHA